MGKFRGVEFANFYYFFIYGIKCSSVALLNFGIRKKGIAKANSGCNCPSLCYKFATSSKLSSMLFYVSAVCEQKVVSNVSSPEGIAVDWVTKKIYWTDGSRNVIEVAEFDGSHRLTLFYDDIHEPRAIVVDPLYGYVKY